MSEKLSFLVRKLPKSSTKQLPREVAVVSVSFNTKSPHYLFKEAHHSVQFHHYQFQLNTDISPPRLQMDKLAIT